MKIWVVVMLVSAITLFGAPGAVDAADTPICSASGAAFPSLESVTLTMPTETQRGDRIGATVRFTSPQRPVTVGVNWVDFVHPQADVIASEAAPTDRVSATTSGEIGDVTFGDYPLYNVWLQDAHGCTAIYYGPAVLTETPLVEFSDPGPTDHPDGTHSVPMTNTSIDLAQTDGSVATARSIDGILSAYDFEATDADTLRLYRAFLNRDPDPGGAVYWIGQSRLGANPDDLAYGFALSDEFIARYGTLDNEAFLTVLYDNMLGRVPDQEGFDYWLGEMNNGLSQPGVVRWIVANEEFIQRFPFSPEDPADPGDAVNCSDFTRQSDAQEWHDHYFPLFGDVANLDGDGDGSACNGLS